MLAISPVLELTITLYTHNGSDDPDILFTAEMVANMFGGESMKEFNTSLKDCLGNDTANYEPNDSTHISRDLSYLDELSEIAELKTQLKSIKDEWWSKIQEQHSLEYRLHHSNNGQVEINGVSYTVGDYSKILEDKINKLYLERRKLKVEAEYSFRKQYFQQITGKKTFKVNLISIETKKQEHGIKSTSNDKVISLDELISDYKTNIFYQNGREITVNQNDFNKSETGFKIWGYKKKIRHVEVSLLFNKLLPEELQNKHPISFRLWLSFLIHGFLGKRPEHPNVKTFDSVSLGSYANGSTANIELRFDNDEIDEHCYIENKHRMIRARALDKEDSIVSLYPDKPESELIGLTWFEYGSTGSMWDTNLEGKGFSSFMARLRNIDKNNGHIYNRYFIKYNEQKLCIMFGFQEHDVKFIFASELDICDGLKEIYKSKLIKIDESVKDVFVLVREEDKTINKSSEY